MMMKYECIVVDEVPWQNDQCECIDITLIILPWKHHGRMINVNASLFMKCHVRIINVNASLLMKCHVRMINVNVS